LVLGASVAPADYLFIQYSMKFKKTQEKDKQGGNPQQPGQPPGQATTNDADFVTIPLNAVAELKVPARILPTVSGRPRIVATTRWGTSTLYNDDTVVVRTVPMPAVKALFVAQRDKLNKDHTPDKVYDLCEWCLEHGLVTEFATLMDETAGAGKKTNLDKLDKAVECYSQVKAALAQRIEREDASNFWRAKLGFRMSQSDHYSLLYNAPSNNPPEVDRRLKDLEENMKGVYFWFALRGVVLNMPEQKLVAVLLDQPDQFIIQRQFVEDEVLVSDGFFAPRDNVVVFSAQRLDFAGVQFDKIMQGYWSQGWDRQALLEGKGASKLAGKSVDEREKASTLALLHKALEFESERAAVSHEGTRQLFVGCGLQKQSVVMPDWLQFGMASVFETPKGPFPLAPAEVAVAYYQGYGMPSWEYTRIFKLLEDDTRKPGDTSLFGLFRDRAQITNATTTMRRVVSDADFTRARDLGLSQAGRAQLI